MKRDVMTRLEYVRSLLFAASAELKSLQYDGDIEQWERTEIHRGEGTIDLVASDVRSIIDGRKKLCPTVSTFSKLIGRKS